MRLKTYPTTKIASAAGGDGSRWRAAVLAGAVFQAVLGCGNSGGGPSPALTGSLAVVAGVPGGSGASDDGGPDARFSMPNGLADDGLGHLYVADTGAATVRRIDIATGAVTTVAGSPGQTGLVDGVAGDARFFQPTGVAIDGGSLYVADLGSVRRVDLATGSVTTLAGGPTAGFYDPSGIAADGHGNLFVADTLNHTVRQVVIATAQVTTLAGQPQTPDEDSDGVGSAAHFGEVHGVATNGDGSLYVTDTMTVRRIDVATATVTTLMRLPDGLNRGDLGGVVIAPDGRLYVTNRAHNTVLAVDIATGATSVVAGVPDMAGSDDGPPPIGRLVEPMMLALASSGGALYVSDYASAVRRIDLATGTLDTVAGQASHAGSSDGVGSAALFAGPRGLATGADGDVFVADAGNHTIRRLTPGTGSVVTVAGSPAGVGTTDGMGSSAQFRTPEALVASGRADLFVVDQAAFTIRRISLENDAVATFAGTAGAVGGADGVGTAARFWTPAQIAYDGAGTLFVADPPNGMIRRIDIATATVSTISTLVTPGIGLATGFPQPTGIAADGAGTLYISDPTLHVIIKLVLSTNTATLLAGQAGVAGALDGVGSAALFNAPDALALDGKGHLFVAEPANHLVRRITLDTGEVTTFAGTRGVASVKAGPLPGGLNAPSGLAVLPSGDLLIADRQENVILLAR
jgi:sugar lactone lactonase YvrE